MKTIWQVIFLAVLFGAPSLAQSQVHPEHSGNDFVRQCSALGRDDVAHETKLEEMPEATFCLGYLSGLRMGFKLEWTFAETYTNHSVPRPFCEPDDVEPGQMAKILLKFIRENPEEAHKTASMLFVEALAKAYPCGR